MTPRASRASDARRVARDVGGGARARRRAHHRAHRRARGRAATRGARWCARRDDEERDARVGGDDGENATTRARERFAALEAERRMTTESRRGADVGPGLAPSAVAASLGAFLFGYHTAACNAPLSALARDLGFADDDYVKGAVVSALVIGGAIGGLTVGGLSDKYGRKWALTATSAPLALGTMLSGMAPNAVTMIAGRFICGLGVGASSQIVPLYLSEIAPPALRGTLNGFRRLAYVFGCLAAFQLAAPLKETGGEGWWRPIFYDAAIPALMLAVGAAFVAQETPVWLLTQSDEKAAEKSRRSLAILQNIRGRAAVTWQNSLRSAFSSSRSLDDDDSASTSIDAEVSASSAAEKPAKSKLSRSRRKEQKLSTWSELISDDKNRLPLSLGLSLCALAAFSGSNTVIFYASTVFTSVGINNPEILTWAVGVPNVVGGFVALALSDKMGRRPLLLTSFGGMSACLGILSLAAYLTPANELSSFCANPELGVLVGKLSQPIDDGLYSYPTMASAQICADFAALSPASAGPAQPEAAVALVTIPLYVLFFSLGAGPIPWLLYNEVFPTRIRARAVSACTALNYVSNSIVGATFLPMVGAYGLSGSYGFYTLLCASGYVFVDRFIPETKGLRLEDVESTLKRHARKRSTSRSKSIDE